MKLTKLTLKSAVIPLICGLLSACSGPGYYMQAISGQWKLNHSRQDIDVLLTNPETSPELASQLELARQIKTFANETLGLPSNGSYETYVAVDGDALVWNVVATEEFSLQARKWCFLVAGCVPYRGYFKQHKAQLSAEKLRKKGMDVHVSPAGAYSSLGWFDDPLLSTMLSGSDARLAAYLIHELAHQRLYVKDDGRFNESYASFVEETGLKAWLESTNRQAELDQWQNIQSASRDFRALVAQLRNQLTRVYQTEQSESLKRQSKAGKLSNFSDSLETLRVEKWQGKRYFSSWSDQPINNARLALYNTYEGSFCAFQNLWQQAGGDAEIFHHLAEEKSRLDRDERSEWLKQSCTGIASPANL